MWEVVLSKQSFETTRIRSHRGETSQMQRLWEVVHSKKYFETTRTHPHMSTINRHSKRCVRVQNSISVRLCKPLHRLYDIDKYTYTSYSSGVKNVVSLKEYTHEKWVNRLNLAVPPALKCFLIFFWYQCTYFQCHSRNNFFKISNVRRDSLLYISAIEFFSCLDFNVKC